MKNRMLMVLRNISILFITLSFSCNSSSYKSVREISIYIENGNPSNLLIKMTEGSVFDELLNELEHLKKIPPKRVNKSAFLEGEYILRIMGEEEKEMVLINKTSIFDENEDLFYRGDNIYQILKELDVIKTE